MRGTGRLLGLGLGLAAAGASADAALDAEMAGIAKDHVRATAQIGRLIVEARGDAGLVERARDSVRERLPEGGGAQFRDLRVVDYEGGRLVCGEVDPAGEAGFTAFVSGGPGAHIYEERSDESFERAFNAGLLDACGR